MLDYVQESVDKTNNLNKEIVDLETVNRTLLQQKEIKEEEKMLSESHKNSLLSQQDQLQFDVSHLW